MTGFAALRLALVLLALAAPVAEAQSRLSPEAFDALATGRSLHFTLNGEPFGAEQFFAGRRSLWRYSDNVCQQGEWRGEGDAICFDYAGEPAPICWHFIETDGRHAAVLLENGVETGFRLDLDRIDTEPLPCPGPRIGS